MKSNNKNQSAAKERLKNNFSKQTKISIISLSILIITVINASQSFAAGLLKPKNGDDSSIHMASHHVDVTINNGFARTQVDQVFSNISDTDLEAIYTFPLPKQSSLSELSLWIDGQEVIGEVLEKEHAKKIYRDQKSKGNDTALAEKNDYKTFEIYVYPVRANADTRVRLVYYQPIEIDCNVGRYVYPLAEGGVDEERIAFWSVDNVVIGSFNFDLELKSAFPIKDIRLPAYQNNSTITKVNNENDNESSSDEIYNVNISSPQGEQLDRDVVIYYRLDDNVPARVEIVPYKEDPNSTGTFMVVVTPAASLQKISEGTDWVFVLDISGSMDGGKIAKLADGVSKTIGKMSPADRYRIITFNDRARDITKGFTPATPENIQNTLNEIKSIRANGGTSLYAGLDMAVRKLDDDRTTGIILVTDGVANIGPTQHSDFINLLKQADVRLFTFVMGNSANQPLMERLAKESNGFAMNISNDDDIIGRIIQAKAKILHTCMHDVDLKFHGEKVKNLTPKKIGSLYQGQQFVIFGQYNGSGDVDVELTAKISGTEQSWHCKATLPDVDTDNPEIERLWAMSQIEENMEQIREHGESQNLREKIVKLGIDYSLVTDYTSMLVIKPEEIENNQIQRNNANRVKKERNAQNKRKKAPVKNYMVTKEDSTPGMFNGATAPGLGTGPVGPLFLIIVMWLKRKRS